MAAVDTVVDQIDRVAAEVVDYCVAEAGMVFAKDHCFAVVDMVLCS